MSLEEMRAKMREKANAKKAPAGQTKSVSTENGSGEKFQSKRWYDTVRADRDRINEAAEYFRAAVEDARQHIIAIGHLETLVAETPGLAFYYKTMHTDAEQIRRWLEERYEIELAQKHKWFMTDPEAKATYGDLKTTEAGKFAKADEELATLSDQIRLMAYYDHLLDDVSLGFQNRAIMLSHLVNIRKEGLQEVWIDPTRETNTE